MGMKESVDSSSLNIRLTLELKKGSRGLSFLKWGGRIAIGLSLVDVVQSFFTGKTVTEYIHPYVICLITL